MKWLPLFVLFSLPCSLAHAQSGEETPAPSEVPAPRANALIFAVGLGYGLGFGTLYSQPSYPSVLPTSNFDPSMRGSVSGLLPLSLGLGYRPMPWLELGVVLDYAHVFLENAPFGGSGSDGHVGGELRFYIVSARAFSLWTSAGLGYEWFGYLANPGIDASRDVSANGYDFDFQVGGDIQVTDRTTIGPYVGLRLGTFRHFRTTCGSRGCIVTDVDIPDANRASHEWLTFGVRGTFALVVR